MGDNDTEDITTDEIEEQEGADAPLDGEDAADGEEGEDSDTPEAPKEPEDAPKRKNRTPADWVALRRGKNLQKAKEGGQGGEGGAQSAAEGDEDEITKKVKDVLGEALNPLFAQQDKEALQTEVNDFIATNPEFKPYSDKVMKWSQDPAWEQVPIEQIFYAAAGKELLQIGAQRRAAADEKARQGRTGGGSSAPDSQKSWSDVPLEDVGKEIERIKMS